MDGSGNWTCSNIIWDDTGISSICTLTLVIVSRRITPILFVRQQNHFFGRLRFGRWLSLIQLFTYEVFCRFPARPKLWQNLIFQI